MSNNDNSGIAARQSLNVRQAVMVIAPEWIDILSALSVHPRCVGELTGILNLQQATLSNRLSKMRKAGLVRYVEYPYQRASAHIRYHEYSLIPDAIQGIAAQIRDTARQIEEVAAQLERSVSKERTKRDRA
jgi:DNA-binding transcriptional ArsR family regulator